MGAGAVIVAAGRGSRVGGDVPKQWQPLCGRTVASRTVETFLAAPEVGPVIFVHHPNDADLAAEFGARGDVTLTHGGATRDASVRAGLEALQTKDVHKVLIHDVARPLVSASLITKVISALNGCDAVAPAVPVSDALWRGASGHVTGMQDRTGLFRAQTPQGFKLEAILAAHREHAGGAHDDVEVALGAGMQVEIVEGDPDNIKITEKDDFARAARLVRDRMGFRIGSGFDVHAFGPGEAVTLCGVTLPHSQGLVGHSDADVGMHALTDAIYGALAQGDIGRHFPPSDTQWKGADSAIFLSHAVELAASMGFGIGNADITLLCEHPKIGPHATQMQDRLETIMRIAPGSVSVKATTTETLGFTGREEGIAAQASVMLVPL